MTEARFNGIELTDTEKKHYIGHLTKLIDAKNKFREQAAKSHRMFSHVVDDFNKISEVPEEVLTIMAKDR